MYSNYLDNTLFLPGDYLRIPKLVFRGDEPALSPYYGLISFGPYEQPSAPPKTILLLYPEHDRFRRIALKIKDALEGGYKRYFPGGFTEIFGVDVDFDVSKLEYSKYNMHRPGNTAEEYRQKFAEVCSDAKACFPVMIMNKVPRGLYESLYTEAKYRFTIDGIPSQVATYETFSDENLFKWSIFPLALQIFVKMGGVPFLLYDRLEIPENEAAIIIGLGLSRLRLGGRELRYIGFALTFEVNGKWRLIKWSPQPYSRDRLPLMLRTLVNDVVDDVLSTYTVERPSKIHVIIHYSGKNISVAEEGAIKSACQRISQVQNIAVIPYVVKIQESMFRTYDEDNPCIDSTRHPTYLANVGTVVKLKEDLYILYTTGCVNVQTGRGEIVSRPNAHNAPSPLIISIKRLEGTHYELRDLELVKSVLYMSRMNYASINNPVSKLPISVKYSKILAYMTSRLAYKLGESGIGDINSLVPQRLRQRLWFI